MEIYWKYCLHPFPSHVILSMQIKLLYSPGAEAFRRRAAGVSAASCRHAALTGPRAASTQSRKKGYDKKREIYFGNCLHFSPKYVYIRCIKRAPAGGGAADWGTRSGMGRAGTGRRTDETVHFPLRSASSSHPPRRRRPEKQAAANRFPVLHLPRAGARTARSQSPHRRALPQRKVVMPMIARK